MPVVKKSKNKAINTSTDALLLSKTRTLDDYMYPEKCLLNNEKSQQWRDRLARTLVHWSEQPDSLEMVQFYTQYKIARQTMHDWKNKHKEIAAALELAKLNISARRLVGNYKKELSDTVYKNLHLLDPEWAEVNTYWAALKNTEQTTPPQQNVLYVKTVVSKEELEKEIGKIHE